MRLTKFQGVVPKLRNEKLAHDFASDAENCLLHSGAIVPLMAPRPIGPTVDIYGTRRTTPPKTLHRAGAAWLGFDSFTAVAEDPIHVAGPDSFLFVQDGQLWRSGYQWIVDKEGPVIVGIDRPITAPTVAATGEVCDATNYGPEDCWTEAVNTGEDCTSQVPPLVLSFCYTWVTACVEESGPSEYSEPILVIPGEGVLLIAPDTAPSNAAKIRWYMLMTDKDNAMMTLIGEQDITELGFSFCPTMFSGNDPLISDTWYRTRCAEGVANIGFGCTLVWSGRDLYPSEVNQPHAYPERYRLTVDDPIVRVVSYLTKSGAYSAVVLTMGVPFVIIGDRPENLTAVRLSRRMPCVTAKSAVLVGNDVFYCSEEGIAVVAGDSVSLVTTNWMDTAWWRKHGTRNYTLGYYDQRLFVFSDTAVSRSFMFSLRLTDTAYEPNDLVYLSAHVTALYQDDVTKLSIAGYGLGGPNVYCWEDSNVPMSARWKSRVFTTSGNWAPTAGKVLTDAQRVSEDAMDWARLIWEQERRLLTAGEAIAFEQHHPEAAHLIPELVSPVVCMELYSDRSPRFARHVWNSRPFRISRKARLTEWSVEVTTTAQVYEIHLAHTIEDLVAEGGDE